MSAIYAWLRRHPMLVDSTLAAMLLAMGLAQVILRPVVMGPPTLLMIAPVVVRRRIPIAAFSLCIASAILQITAARGPTVADLAVLVMIYTVAAYRPRRVSVAVLLTVVAGSDIAVVAWAPELGGSLWARLGIGTVALGGSALAAWILGDSMRYRRGYYAALEDKAARLEAERHAQAKIAAAAERARIARELHDVVAHHVSVMVVQADGASYALKSDPARAEVALHAISDTGRQALNQMRHLLGVLRTGNEQAALAPMPGLGELRELLDQARTAGLDVTYTLTGKARALPGGVELAAYRVVQESLTNTRKHGGLAATAAVTLRYEPTGLTVEVTDDGIAAAQPGMPGHGLTGMRERIAMYGGTVQAGPLPNGGFGVLAHIPYPVEAGRQPTHVAVTDSPALDLIPREIAVLPSGSNGSVA
jgi:signal transduction histidine kinase